MCSGECVACWYVAYGSVGCGSVACRCTCVCVRVCGWPGLVVSGVAFVVLLWVFFLCEGVFILSITSNPENTGLFSLPASCFSEFQLFTAHSIWPQ